MAALTEHVHADADERWRGVGSVSTGSGKVVAYIDVPPQPPELRPFMLRETTSTGQQKTHSVAIPIRSGAETEYDSPEALHSLIVAGRAALRQPQD